MYQSYVLSHRNCCNNFVYFFFICRVATNNTVDWTREFRNNSMFHSIELKRWYVITTTRASKLTEDLIKSLQQVGRGMAFTIAKPRM